jgi:hypothetical protein
MRQLLLVAATLVSAMLVWAGPSFASCAEDSGPTGAPVVFVGTAQIVERGYTRFQVEEVRAGPDLAPQVWVLSGQPQPAWPLSVFSDNAQGEHDVDFTLGSRYVVGASHSFATDACRVSPATAGANSADARQPVDHGNHGAERPIGPLGQTLWVAGILVLVAATVALLSRLRRRGRPTSAPPS